MLPNANMADSEIQIESQRWNVTQCQGSDELEMSAAVKLAACLPLTTAMEALKCRASGPNKISG